jgi:hypothetical protein
VSNTVTVYGGGEERETWSEVASLQIEKRRSRRWHSKVPCWNDHFASSFLMRWALLAIQLITALLGSVAWPGSGQPAHSVPAASHSKIQTAPSLQPSAGSATSNSGVRSFEWAQVHSGQQKRTPNWNKQTNATSTFENGPLFQPPEDNLGSDTIDQRLPGPGDGDESAVFNIAQLPSGSASPDNWLSERQLPFGRASNEKWIPPFSPNLSRSDIKRHFQVCQRELTHSHHTKHNLNSIFTEIRTPIPYTLQKLERLSGIT